MDLKLKGISWAGNFYQKFEKVCHEVDNIVNQEAVKYVENQVQTVGKNMKKFYSDVMTDMLHPLMDPVKHDVQGKSLERNAAIHTHTHIESEMVIDEHHADEEDEQSQSEPSEFDPIEKQPDHALSSLHLIEQLNPLTNMDPLEAADSDQASRQIADAFTNSNSYLKFEESTLTENPCLYEVSELTSPGKEDFFGGSLRDDSKCVSYSSSALKSTEMVSSIASAEGNMVYADDFSSRSPLRESFLLDNSNKNSPERAVSCHSAVDLLGFVSHPVLPSSLSTTTLSSENKVSETGLISSSSVPSSELINSLSTLRSAEMMRSVVSSEKNIVDAADFSSRLPSRGSSLLDDSNESSPARASSCHSPVDVAGFIPHTVLPSSLSSTTLCGEKMRSDAGLISSSNVLSAELIGPSDDNNDEVNVSSMELETIDLCDNAKLEDSCVYVDNSALYAVPHTLRKHRSYKQMFRDALTARKRLEKEYEQLAIWFGDADMGSNKESMQSLLPSTTTTTTTMGCGNLQTELEGDSGWELL